MSSKNNRPGTGYPGLAAAGVALAILSGCAAGQENGEEDQAGADRKRVLAPIDAAEVRLRESSPPRYTVHVTTGLPSGCAEFAGIDLERQANRIEMTIWNTIPADDDVVCTMIYRTTDNVVELGNDFRPGKTYSVHINNEKTVEFTAQVIHE